MHAPMKVWLGSLPRLSSRLNSAGLRVKTQLSFLRLGPQGGAMQSLPGAQKKQTRDLHANRLQLGTCRFLLSPVDTRSSP